MVGGQAKHTLYIANDLTADASNPNQFFVFVFDDADLHGAELVPQRLAASRQ